MPSSTTSFATTTGGISTYSSANPSFALAAYKEEKPLNGTASEWLYAGASRSSDAQGSDMKDKMDGWDKKWAELQQKK